ncbi:MAG: GTPase ObgE [Fibromonadaceae bacterium]|jgi:GTP-binding protein|nr:GTPase ObgE [Fibromonadaceae bacterium]
MFLDEKAIEVVSGKGGGGICSFRREKHVPLGGPDGGDGGNGGCVYLRANEQYTTLLDMGNAYRYAAEAGASGEAANRTGRSGKSIYVDVPRGTIVRDSEGRILTDLTDGGSTWMAAQGGAGGLGNSRFATSLNRAPRQHTSGKPGEKRILNLELKLMADVGLVGLPNAGKSSLVRKISSAKPKVADYPFTTIEPVLGIVQSKNRSFVVADIPGIIEGASEGKGLGHRFLRHIERTKALLFVIDGFEEKSWKTFCLLKKELETFHPKLLEKKFVVALNKSDLDISKAKKEFTKHKQAFIETCALSGDGCQDLSNALSDIVFVNEVKKWK